MNDTIVFTQMMFLLVGALSAFFQGIKSRVIDKYPQWEWVKELLPIPAVLIGWLLCWVTNQVNPPAAGFVVGAVACWGYDMFAGLIGKNPPVAPVLLICCLAILIVGGCNEVQMSPQYQQVLEMSAINVSELDKRCQGGDNVACKDGLHQAARTLNLLVDATHGRGSDPNS